MTFHVEFGKVMHSVISSVLLKALQWMATVVMTVLQWGSFNLSDISGSWGLIMKSHIKLFSKWQRTFNTNELVIRSLNVFSDWLIQYLACPLQIPKVHIRNKQNRLGVQIRHRFKKGGVRFFRNGYCSNSSILSWWDDVVWE